MNDGIHCCFFELHFKLLISVLFRTEQHRLSRCDLARGWWPKVA
ncbi:hypothetical protein T08_1371, partial [Trichinella sp. T8]